MIILNYISNEIKLINSKSKFSNDKGNNNNDAENHNNINKKWKKRKNWESKWNDITVNKSENGGTQFITLRFIFY